MKPLPASDLDGQQSKKFLAIAAPFCSRKNQSAGSHRRGSRRAGEERCVLAVVARLPASCHETVERERGRLTQQDRQGTNVDSGCADLPGMPAVFPELQVMLLRRRDREVE